MLNSNEVISAYVRYQMIALNLTGENKIYAHSMVSAYRHVLQLPYSSKCRGLTVEGIELFCKEAITFYNNLHCVNYSLREYFKVLDFKDLHTQYETNLYRQSKINFK